jgi:hypothetical protein
MASGTSNLSNAEIADPLAGLAQLLSTQKENHCKIKAYQRAAAKIRRLSESVEELVAISHAVQEIVRTGTLGKLDQLRSKASPKLAGLSHYPRLDPKRVLHAYKKFGRSLLKRPGHELDMDRIIRHAKQNRCFFEINSSPDRRDLSAENARLAGEAGVKIAISTDAHSTRESGTVRCRIDQARRAGIEPASILNCLQWPSLEPFVPALTEKR